MRKIVERVDRLQRLAVFEAAARLGSFTAAANELGMTQPAVTRHIRSLERSLGSELFARTSNRSELTDAGRRLRNHVTAGFEAIETGLDELNDNNGTFVLASHPGVAQQWLMPRLDDIQEVLGSLDLRLWLFDQDRDLVDGSHDAAIRVGDGNFVGQDKHRMFDEIVLPVAAPAVAERWGLHADSTAEEVYGAPFVHMDDGEQPWMSWSDWLSEFGITLRRQPGRVLYNNYPMVVQQMLAGRGIGLGWRPLIDDLLASGGLVVVGPEVRSQRAYYLTWPRGQQTEAVDRLRIWLADNL